MRLSRTLPGNVALLTTGVARLLFGALVTTGMSRLLLVTASGRLWWGRSRALRLGSLEAFLQFSLLGDILDHILLLLLGQGGGIKAHVLTGLRRSQSFLPCEQRKLDGVFRVEKGPVKGIHLREWGESIDTIGGVRTNLPSTGGHMHIPQDFLTVPYSSLFVLIHGGQDFPML